MGFLNSLTEPVYKKVRLSCKQCWRQKTKRKECKLNIKYWYIKKGCQFVPHPGKTCIFLVNSYLTLFTAVYWMPVCCRLLKHNAFVRHGIKYMPQIHHSPWNWQQKFQFLVLLKVGVQTCVAYGGICSPVINFNVGVLSHIYTTQNRYHAQGIEHRLAPIVKKSDDHAKPKTAPMNQFIHYVTAVCTRLQYSPNGQLVGSRNVIRIAAFKRYRGYPLWKCVEACSRRVCESEFVFVVRLCKLIEGWTQRTRSNVRHWRVSPSPSTSTGSTNANTPVGVSRGLFLWRGADEPPYTVRLLEQTASAE